MKRNKVIFRVDANSGIGLGHLVRCLALAEMICTEFQCSFAVRDPQLEIWSEITNLGCEILLVQDAQLFVHQLSGSEIVVLDGYQFDSELQRQIKMTGCKLVCIDDLSNQHFYADVVINHSLSARADQYSTEPYTRILTGRDYVLLRKEFITAEAAARSNGKAVSIAFISFGGSDKHDFSKVVADLLTKFSEVKHINLLVGSAYSGDIAHLRSISGIRVYQNLSPAAIVQVINASDFGVVSASGIAYECAALDLPLIVGYYIEHQKEFYDALIGEPNIVGIGDFQSLDLESLRTAVTALKMRPVQQRNFIDRKQQPRLLEVFRQLSAE